MKCHLAPQMIPLDCKTLDDYAGSESYHFYHQVRLLSDYYLTLDPHCQRIQRLLLDHYLFVCH